MIRYLLDANSCIHLLAGTRPVLTERVANSDTGSIGVPAIALAEVALGSTRGKPPPPEVLDAFVAEIAVLPFDLDAARHYTRLPFRRASFDRLIAAQALSIGASIVTANLRDFADIPGLVAEDWTR